MTTRAALLLLLLLLALSPAARAQEGAASAQALAASLRGQDPETRSGGRLALYVLRQVVAPKADPSIGAPPEALAALAGWSRGADRSLLPEFDAARSAHGRSIREHLLNAVYMNASRMGWYGDHAGGLLKRWRSRLLSRYMIVGEAVAILGVSARGFDAKARNARARYGVDVLVGDLVPLRPLPVVTPPHFRGVATRAQRRTIQGIVGGLEDEVRAALDRGDLRRIVEVCRAALVRVVACEEAWRVHFQMTRHTIGSIGFAALRGDQHARVAPTRDLSVSYIRATIGSTFSYGQRVDRLAQPLQARGLGIVVNEFTDEAFTDALASEAQGLVTVVVR